MVDRRRPAWRRCCDATGLPSVDGRRSMSTQEWYIRSGQTTRSWGDLVMNRPGSRRTSPSRRIGVLSIRLRFVVALGLVGLLGGCRSETPWVASEPDDFVADGPGKPWRGEDERNAGPLVSDAETERRAEGPGPLARMEARTPPLPAGPEGIPGEKVSLLHLVDFALANRPETRVAWERARAAAAELGISQGAWLPTIGLSADFYYSRVLFPANGIALQVESLSALPQIALNYVLLDFGRREADDDAARARLLAANLEADRVLQETVHGVQIGYFQLDAAIAAREAALRNLELAQTVVEMVESQVNAGLATAPDLFLARQDLARARFDLQSTVASIQSARSALLGACGVPASIPIEIARVRDDQLPEVLTLRVEDVIDVGLQGRPDLAAAVAEVRAATAEEARAKAEFLPTLSTTGSFGYDWSSFQTATQGPNGVETFPEDSDGIPVWNVGLSANWMLFEGLARENAVRAARARRRAAEAELEKVRLQAIGETWDAYFRVRAYRDQFDFGEALLDQSRETFEAVTASYQQGLATITELVQSERDLQEARAVFVKTRADLLVAAADLALSSGLEVGRISADRLPAVD